MELGYQGKIFETNAFLNKIVRIFKTPIFH